MFNEMTDGNRSPIAATLGALIVLALMLTFFFRGCSGTEPALVSSADVRVTRTVDTVREVLPGDTVRITEYVPRIVYRERRIVAQLDTAGGRRDTVLLCEPFKTELMDTTVNGVTIRQAIAFPPLRIAELYVATRPDTVYSTREALTVTHEVTRAPPWYEEVGKAALFVAVGYGLRLLTEPDPSPDNRPLDKRANVSHIGVSLKVPF